MGVSFSASVVVGMRLSDFCAIRETETTETRYNDRTGVPYEHKARRKAVFILGVEVPGLDLSPGEWEKTLGMSVFGDHRNFPESEALDRAIAGVEIASSNSHRGDFEPISVVQHAAIDRAVKVTIPNARATLREHLGVPELIDTAPVQLFLLANVSC